MNIKIFSGLLLLLGSMLITTSCHDDLNIKQPSQFTLNSMWTDENDFETAINGAYSLFRSTFSDWHNTYGDLRADYLESGSVNSAYYNRIPTNDILIGDDGTNWFNIYRVINAVNLILKHIDNINFQNVEKRNTVLANAYFLRAYLYYTVARVWGDAPILTVGFESERQEDMYPSRSSAADVYALVESDIELAASLIPAGKSLHQASPAAIHMLRADYYSWKASRLDGGTEALSKAQSSINSVLGAGYTLAPSFANLIGTENETNDEYIFTMPYTLNENVTAGSSPNFYALFLAPSENWLQLSGAGYTQEVIPTGSHQQYVAPQQSFCDFMKSEPLDTRTHLTIREFTDEFIVNEIQVKRMIVKFQGSWISGTRAFDTDMPIYRLGEAYLLKAEIENKLGNTTAALEALNTIAKRAYGVDNYYTTTNSDEIAKAICNETLKELALEGKIWWTYIRNNKAFEMIGSLVGREHDYEGNILLWPVATACINTNSNITQTPGFVK